jgi:hypothetical protein
MNSRVRRKRGVAWERHCLVAPMDLDGKLAIPYRQARIDAVTAVA